MKVLKGFPTKTFISEGSLFSDPPKTPTPTLNPNPNPTNPHPQPPWAGFWFLEAWIHLFQGSHFSQTFRNRGFWGKTFKTFNSNLFSLFSFFFMLKNSTWRFFSTASAYILVIDCLDPLSKMAFIKTKRRILFFEIIIIQKLMHNSFKKYKP